MPAMELADFNREAVANFQSLLDGGQLHLVKNRCLCDNQNESKDITVSGKDRYGFAIPQILCSKCGLIRSGLVLDEESNNKFYQYYYRNIYTAHLPIDQYFDRQTNRGAEVLKLVEEHIDISELAEVAEIGCGAGGLLLPFQDRGIETVGFDFNEEYLQYGNSKGMHLLWGDFHTLAKEKRFDLIILSHVFEHYTNPLQELQRILEKVKINGYIYIQVPGIYSIPLHYKDPLTYFQNAHVYNFFEHHLRVLFESFGLKVIYGDERCTFLVQKVEDETPQVEEVFDESLTEYFEKNANFLISCKKTWDNRDRKTIKQRLYTLACALGWRRLRTYIKPKHKYMSNE